MNQDNSTSMGPILIGFLAGAAVGAVLVALTTPKSGPELRGDLKDYGRRAKRQVGQAADDACAAWDGMQQRTALAAGDLKRGMADAGTDLKRGMAEAASDFRG